MLGIGSKGTLGTQGWYLYSFAGYLRCLSIFSAKILLMIGTKELHGHLWVLHALEEQGIKNTVNPRRAPGVNPMIKTLHLSNFRSLGDDVLIKLERFNFFVGINGSGKSNILRALSFLREVVRFGLSSAITNANGIDSLRRHSEGRPRNTILEVELSLQGRTARYLFELTGDKSAEFRVKRELAYIESAEGVHTYEVKNGIFRGPENLRPNLDQQSLVLTALGGDTRFSPLWLSLANTMAYSINPAVLRQPQKFGVEPHLSEQGENWVSILHTQAEKPWLKDMTAALEKLTGDIDDVKVTKAAGYLIATFHHKNVNDKARKWFSADLESDGTLRVAGILTALLQEPPLPVLGIEEPEQTVHPGAIPLLYDYLLEASTRSQILITTHSPILLDHVNLDDARVFVAERRDGATSVRSISEESRSAVKNKLLTLGEMLESGQLSLDLDEGKAA